MIMRITLNIFQRRAWSISAERCKQLCDWNACSMHLNTEFSGLYMSCFLIATCSMAILNMPATTACQGRYSKASGTSLPSWLPRGLRFKQMQALLISQNERVCKTYRGKAGTANAVSFCFPPSHILRMCACVSQDKRGYKAANTMETDTTKNQGLKPDCFLINLTQIIPETCFTLSTGWNFL